MNRDEFEALVAKMLREAEESWVDTLLDDSIQTQLGYYALVAAALADALYPRWVAMETALSEVTAESAERLEIIKRFQQRIDGQSMKLQEYEKAFVKWNAESKGRLAVK